MPVWKPKASSRARRRACDEIHTQTVRSNIAGPAETVDQLLDRLAHALKPELLALRARIASAEARLAEHIKWNAPSHQFEGHDCIAFNFFARDKIRWPFTVEPRRTSNFQRDV